MKLRYIGYASVFSLLAGLPMLTAPTAHAASFDCAKAGNGIERMICGDPALSDLDGKLQDTYRTALAAADHGSKKPLTKEQHDWIQYTRALCQDIACLRQAYAARIAVLARNEKYIIDQNSCETPDGATRCVSTTVIRDPNWRVASFNRTLADQNKSGQIIGCTMLLELPGMSTDSNASYGGYCVLDDGRGRTEVKICNDDMIGQFGMEPTDPAKESKQDLLDFVNECPGG